MSDLELTRPRHDVALITLNRPDQLNALNFVLVEELHHTLDLILTARTVENRSQILASSSGEMRAAAAAFANRKKD